MFIQFIQERNYKMKKITKILCIALIFTQLFSISSAFASKWSLDQVIGFVDAITIDGTHVFNEKSKGTFGGPNPNNFFTMNGAVLFWFGDVNRGEFWLFDQDGKHLCVWEKVEKRYYNSIMPVLLGFLRNYVDFQNGGKITFIITKTTDFSNPFIQLEYSPYAKKSSSVYSDANKFCDQIKQIVESTILYKN